MPLPALAGVALRHGLAGLEFGVAIPATLGGAVRMNAGAHGGAMADVGGADLTYRLREGRAEPVDAADAGFGYRRSACRPMPSSPAPSSSCTRTMRSGSVNGWTTRASGAAGPSRWRNRTAGACSRTRRATTPPG